MIDIAPSITYAPNDDIITTVNTTISSSLYAPSVTGGAVTSWEISPSTSGYFHFNQVSGRISGSSNTLLTRTMFTIWGNNSGGSAVAYINFTVNDAISQGITVSPNENTTLTNNSAMNPITFTSSGPGEIVTWELEGELPTGLTFTSTNQTIWGMPTELMATTPYTIWANNTGGPVSALSLIHI